MKARHVRFWTISGRGAELVRIKVPVGKAVSYARGGAHEEGWSRSGEEWEAGYVRILPDGTLRGHVVRTSWSDGSDCDGRHSDEAREWCDVRDLARLVPHESLGAEPGIRLPRWRDPHCTQRDYRAEAAGY